MTIKFADRVKETTTTTGTTALSLGGAASGFRTFVAGVGSGNQALYTLLDADLVNWEMGIGTVTDGAPDTLSRTTILKSTNADAAISLSAGTHTVFIGPEAGTRFQALEDIRLSGFLATGDGVATQSLSASTWTKLTVFPTEVFDIDGDFDVATSRFTPSKAGVWLIGGVGGAKGLNNTVQLAVYKNGAIYSKLGFIYNGGTLGPVLNGQALAVANGTTDYFELYAIFGGAKDAQNSAEDSQFWARYIGKNA